MTFATVIIPTYDHGPLLGLAIDSVLRQTRQDFEIVVIGDGVPAHARPHVEAACHKDPRIRFLDKPKSARTGERYRHEYLSRADSEIVGYLSDDDLWLPDHLERVAWALQEADFVNTWFVQLRPDNSIGAFRACLLGRPEYRAMLLSGTNRVPLSCVAHRLAAYRRLPHGWRHTPRGTPSDLYMWQQWLNAPGIRYAGVMKLTVLVFPDVHWRELGIEARSARLEEWLEAVHTPAKLQELTDRCLATLLKVAVETELTTLNLRAGVLKVAKLAASGSVTPPAFETALAEIVELAKPQRP